VAVVFLYHNPACRKLGVASFSPEDVAVISLLPTRHGRWKTSDQRRIRSSVLVRKGKYAVLG
jgi:hypothetical protein